jgi:uncharacterized membrane protein YcjF (UPF0283 family)
MDWMFYLIVSVALFVVFAAILAIRYYLNERLAKLERIEEAEEEARNIAESHSGL